MLKKPPRWYFSFRSPYSWFAYLDLVRCHGSVAESVEWIPFWEPSPHMAELLEAAAVKCAYSPMSRDKHFYILQDAKRLARDRGLAMTWPLDRNPCWEVCHLAYFVADALGCGQQYVAAVYRARWEQGRDICDPDTIAAIATEIGADPGVLAGAADDPLVRQRGTAALAAASRDGVFGVPFFVAGREKFWGVERLEAFVSANAGLTGPQLARSKSPLTAPEQEPAQDIQLPPSSVEPDLTPSADGGHAGGCG